MLTTLLRVVAAPGIEATPLAPRAGRHAATLFTLVPPQESGITVRNEFADPKMWTDRNLEFSLGSIGTGLAVGDFDNDGKPDLFVVTKTGQCRLYRNLGHWKFEDVTEHAGLLLNYDAEGWLDKATSWIGTTAPKASMEAWQQGAAFADVNNDGWLDLYICRFNAPNLLYINQHDGTFKEEAAARGLAVVDSCGMAAFCDYDRDGWLDVYVQTSMRDGTKRPTGEHDYLFHNNRDGTFTDVTVRAGISGDTLAHSSTWWDYDEDGWPDLYVSNDFAGVDRLYHNNRDGTFTEVAGRVLPHVPYSAMGADLGDINNDGRIDLLVADMAATTHEKDQRGMATSRELYGDDSTTGLPQYPRNALYVNTGAGRMLEAASLAGLAATDWTWALQLADFDNDGRLDLFVTNGMVREYQNADLRQRIIVAENMDERLRIMRANPTMPERHLAFRNLGDLQFKDVGAAWGLDQVGIGFGAVTADFDGDGDLDLVYANYDRPPTVLRNDGDAGHRLVVSLRGTRSNRFGVGAVVRIATNSGPQVRDLVLARGYLSTSEPNLHFGLGEDTVVQQLVVEWPSGARQVFADVKADQHVTITEPENAASEPGSAAGTMAPAAASALFENVGDSVGLDLPTTEVNRDQASQPLVPTRFSRRGPALAAVENASGELDLVLAATSGSPLRRVRQASDGHFAAEDLSGLDAKSSLPDGPVLVFAATKEGRRDVLLTKSGVEAPAGSTGYQPRLLLDDGQGGLRPAAPDALPSLPLSVGALAAADVNHDGLLDLFVGGRAVPGSYPTAPESALLFNRDGRFEDVTASFAPELQRVGMVTSALWSDVDGDGWLDLLIALDWGGVKYFHNDGGRRLTDWTDRAGFAAAGTGWWTSLASADFNGDGKPDFVAGNTGLNTIYQASTEQPALLFYGDFGGKVNPLLIEAYYENGRLYPRRTRNVLAAFIPAIGQRYRRNDIYARSTLEEIVGADRLAHAQRFAATELRSGVFLSQADGRYRFEPLPRIAQIAPAQGIVAVDVDGDGFPDIALVQNSFAPIPSVGHFDGGLGEVLYGDGRGGFEAVPALDSGLVVAGDAKALVVVDLDHNGWPDLVATRNNSTTLAFRNAGRKGRHSLALSLREKGANPTAVGARVELELADGTRQVAEIGAGSGYYSQSAPVAFFGWRDGNPPRLAKVRWPDGHATTHPVDGKASTVTLANDSN